MAEQQAAKIEFLQYHRPGLEDGDYTITVSQTISDKNGKIEQAPFTQQQHFSVLGPRFSLDAQEIVAVFPPAGSLGEHSNVLPHIMLKRSTLPWEREVDHASPTIPWLALLLFDQDETPTVQTVTLADLGFPNGRPKANIPANTVFPCFSQQKLTEPYLLAEKGQHPDDKLTLIYLKPSLLAAQLPSKAGLPWLAHVRQGKNEQDELVGEEVAVIMGCRLPAAGSQSTVHLVSLEGLYDEQDFVYRHQDDSQQVALVSLKSWRFACASERHSFKGLLLHLNHHLLFNLPLADCQSSLNQLAVSDGLRLAFQSNKRPLSEPVVATKAAWRVKDGRTVWFVGTDNHVYNQAGKFLFTLRNQPASLDVNFANSGHPLSPECKFGVITDGGPWWLNDGQKGYFLQAEGDRLFVYELDGDSSATLRLPRYGEQSEPYLKQGFVPAAHQMRQGNKTVSWYHGPLRPGRDASLPLPLPVRSADQLVRYDPAGGMFNISYAAAWELGRLLTLQNNGVATALFNWKRANAQQLKDADYRLAHLPIAGPSLPPAFPPTVDDWFARLQRLEGVPFSYLVAHPALLPAETIRFFWLDPLWVDCLVDGAFSIGRVSAGQLKQDGGRPAGNSSLVTGFLLRSEVVAGWPGLLIEGYGDLPAQPKEALTQPPLPMLRFERLSKNVLLCLFAGQLKVVDIHQKPETLHFGLSRPEADGIPDYYKELRGLDNQTVPVSWQDKAARIVNIAQLATEMQTKFAPTPFTPAQFALQLIEGVEKVRFFVSEGSDGPQG